MDKHELYHKLEVYCRGKSQCAVAKEMQISSQYLNDIMQRKRAVMCPPVLKFFGYKKRIIVSKISP